MSKASDPQLSHASSGQSMSRPWLRATLAPLCCSPPYAAHCHPDVGVPGMGGAVGRGGGGRMPRSLWKYSTTCPGISASSSVATACREAAQHAEHGKRLGIALHSCTRGRRCVPFHLQPAACACYPAPWARAPQPPAAPLTCSPPLRCVCFSGTNCTMSRLLRRPLLVSGSSSPSNTCNEDKGRD